MTAARHTRRKTSDVKRQLLIDAALTVVARDGVAAATTRRIAEEAGLPLGTVHYWFADKDDLLREVISVMLSRVSEASNTVAQAGGDPLARLRAAFAVVAKDDPGRQLALYELTAHALRTPELRDLARIQYASYVDEATRQLQPWIDQIEAHLPGGAHALAVLLTATFDGLVLGWLANPDDAGVDDALTLFADLLQKVAVS